ncbi:MAG: endolytic transglycosylase MltG [Treponema sp.]|nr:endolytic transglycosylase MltG [Treponema sp.]
MHKIAKRIFAIAAFVIGAVLLIGLAVIGTLVYFNSPPEFSHDAAMDKDGVSVEPSEGEEISVRFDVRRGESAVSVGRRLEDSGLIRSLLFWQLLCRFDKEPIKTGSYLLEVPASQIAIHRLLVSGRQILLRITIPEGLTVKKTARLLESAGVCTEEDFIAAAVDPETIDRYRIPGESMEGYLYPDTYLFPPEYPAARVVRAMADNFFAKIAGIDGDILSKPPEELNRLVTLASIIEREYRLDEEAPVMAGVFVNRLGIGMALQSCATVEYVITEIQGRPHPGTLYARDLEIRDPYNTYLRPGLPPGPISSPGTVALRAALEPAETRYMYFRLVDPASGKHYFSTTLDDHIRAGVLYLKGGF